jgi:glycosyltransferase involved in cell wall biosynthesis
VFNSDLSDVHYRVVVPLRELARRGHEVVYVQPDASGHVAPERLLGCDAVHVHRRAEKDVVDCADELRDAGVAITWDTDDDPRLAVSDELGGEVLGSSRREREFRRQLAMMARAGIVTTPCEALAERYREVHDGDVVVVENYLCDEQFAFASRDHRGVVVGWVGTPDQATDAERLGTTTMLRRVMERDPRVHVVSVGVWLDLDPDRYTYHRELPFEHKAAYLRQIDIGLAPLADLPANAARSNIAVKEYAAAGVPWIASARGPYLGTGEAEGGMLAGDEDWEAAILSLTGARFRRRQLRRYAEQWAKSHHIAAHADQWQSVFETATATIRQAA